jgi:hypothetical protein
LLFFFFACDLTPSSLKPKSMSAYSDFLSKKSDELGDVSRLMRKQLGTSEHREASRDAKGVYSGVWVLAKQSVVV